MLIVRIKHFIYTDVSLIDKAGTGRIWYTNCFMNAQYSMFLSRVSSTRVWFKTKQTPGTVYDFVYDFMVG